MSLPLWDNIELPPGTTLVDINGTEPTEYRENLQAQALELWIDLTGQDSFDREWSDEEGIFVMRDGAGEDFGIYILADVEDA